MSWHDILSASCEVKNWYLDVSNLFALILMLEIEMIGRLFYWKFHICFNNFVFSSYRVVWVYLLQFNSQFLGVFFLQYYDFDRLIQKRIYLLSIILLTKDVNYKMLSLQFVTSSNWNADWTCKWILPKCFLHDNYSVGFN